MRQQERTAPSRGDGIGAEKALGYCNPIVAQAAGSTVSYYVAMEHNPMRPLSGKFNARAEGLRVLAWLRNRYPGATLIRKSVFFEACP